MQNQRSINNIKYFSFKKYFLIQQNLSLVGRGLLVDDNTIRPQALYGNAFEEIKTQKINKKPSEGKVYSTFLEFLSTIIGTSNLIVDNRLEI